MSTLPARQRVVSSGRDTSALIRYDLVQAECARLSRFAAWGGHFCVQRGAGKANQMTFTASRLLIVIALVLFVLAAFGVTLPIVELVALGLAFLAASFLVP
jgi:hypothetical protein